MSTRQLRVDAFFKRAEIGKYFFRRFTVRQVVIARIKHDKARRIRNHDEIHVAHRIFDHRAAETAPDERHKREIALRVFPARDAR
jgi:hypothetical protein